MSHDVYVRAELAQTQLAPFVSLFNPGYKFGWFNLDLCARLDRFRREIEEGLAPCLMINVPPRHGKDLLLETPILTPNGWTTIADLSVGDFVFGADGRPKRVLEKSEIFRNQPLYKVEMARDRWVLCGPGHEWLVQIDGSETLMTAEALAQVQRNKQARIHDASPLDFPDEQDLPIDPYLLGFWLGDGDCTSSKLYQTGDDLQELVTLLDQRGIEHTANHTSGFTNIHGLVKKVRALGLYRNKHIPEIYLRANIHERLELLRGLIDSDGYVAAHANVVEITLGAPERVDRLALEIEELLFTLGMPPRTHIDRRGARRVTFNPTRADLSYYVRKRERLDHNLTRASLHPRPISVSRVGYGDTQCIQVDGGLFLAGPGLMVTHNSELGSRNFPAQLMGIHPEYQIISATHSAPLALDNSRDVLRILRDELYPEVFPHTRLDSKNNAATGWRTTKGGKYKPAGAGQGIAGYGANLLVIDDPHKDTEGFSEVVCEQTWRWYVSAALTRLMPLAGQLVIQTRWSHFDLCGRLLEEQGRLEEGGRWEVVLYPAEAIYDEYRDPRTGIISYQPVEGYELLRRAGDALHPERYSLESLERIRASDPIVWNALYQQNPLSGDVVLFKELDKANCLLEDIPERLQTYTVWDLAGGQKEITRNAYSAAVTVGVDTDNTIWVLDVFRDRKDMYEIAQTMLDQYEKYNQELIGIEEMQAATALMPFLDREAEARNMHAFPVTLLKTRNQDKVARAQPIQAMMRKGSVKIPTDAEWSGMFYKELEAFPLGRYKDMVDAFAWAGQVLSNLTFYQRESRHQKDHRQGGYKKLDASKRIAPARSQRKWKTV